MNWIKALETKFRSLLLSALLARPHKSLIFLPQQAGWSALDLIRTMQMHAAKYTLYILGHFQSEKKYIIYFFSLS